MARFRAGVVASPAWGRTGAAAPDRSGTVTDIIGRASREAVAVLYDLHVFGLNLSGMPDPQRRALALSRADTARLLRTLARMHPVLEVVVVRGSHHLEAFVAAPRGARAARAWIAGLRAVRPDLLAPALRPRHYHLAGAAAARHLGRVAQGQLAARPSSATDGVKAALGLAARCGTLGETLDGLFVRALGAARRVRPEPVPRAESPP